jgi:hypothetical protein
MTINGVSSALSLLNYLRTCLIAHNLTSTLPLPSSTIIWAFRLPKILVPLTKLTTSILTVARSQSSFKSPKPSTFTNCTLKHASKTLFCKSNSQRHHLLKTTIRYNLTTSKMTLYFSNTSSFVKVTKTKPTLSVLSTCQSTEYKT